MYQEGDHYHYSEEEVAKIFQPDYEIRNWEVNDSEYISLCKLIACLRKEHVDILHNDIYLVVMSLERDKRMEDKKMPCAFINLRDQSFLDSKKAIIILSPYLLSTTHACAKLKKILHEVGHYVQNHPMNITDTVEHEKLEHEAECLALTWFKEECHHLNNLGAGVRKKHNKAGISRI